MKCVCCDERESKHQKRRLCETCYSGLRRSGNLDLFPSVFPLENGWIKKYGDKLIEDLETLISNTDITLERVAQKHNVTRERVRQMFELFYGFKYSVAKKVKWDKEKRARYEISVARKNPYYKVDHYRKESNLYKGAVSEKAVYDICASLGFEIKPYETQTIDLVVNGYNVAIKSAHKTCFTHPGVKTPQYHFQRLPSQLVADFVVCHAVPMNAFFVIPTEAYPPRGHLYLPSTKTSEWFAGKGGKIKRKTSSKYYDYLEAWHLLEKEPDEVIFSPLKLVV